MPFNEAGSLHVKRILVAEIAVADAIVGGNETKGKSIIGFSIWCFALFSSCLLFILII